MSDPGKHDLHEAMSTVRLYRADGTEVRLEHLSPDPDWDEWMLGNMGLKKADSVDPSAGD